MSIDPTAITSADFALFARLGIGPDLLQMAGPCRMTEARIAATVLHLRKYDDQTGLFLTEDWPELSANPTHDDALATLASWRDHFGSFRMLGQRIVLS
jgi:hypothetical protein